jgi:hypothetical protein
MKKDGNILVITYWDFNEAHIQANVLPNLKILSTCIAPEAVIYLFCFNKKNVGVAEKAGLEQALSPFRIRLLFFDYTHFGIRMILRYGWLVPYLCLQVLRKRITHLYAWCTTAGAIGYLVSVITRKPLILESYEPHAEAMVENGYWHKGHYAYRILSFFEKRQARRAAYVIAANSGMKEYVMQRYQYAIPDPVFFSKPAMVDLSTFFPDEQLRREMRSKLGYRDSDIVCLYAGKFGGIYLKEEVFDLLKTAADFWGQKLKILLLTAHTKEEVLKLADQAGVPADCFTVLFVNHQEVPGYMRAGDFALCPVKPVPTKRYCTPVKDGEYWATGLPVVITQDISDDSGIIASTQTGAVLAGCNRKEYEKAIREVDLLLQQSRGSLTARIRELAETYRNYSIAGRIYRAIYNPAP